MSAGHAYRFQQDAARMLLEALGLSDRKVRRIELVFDVDEPVTLTVWEYAQIENHVGLCSVLALGEWHGPQDDEVLDG